MAQRDLGELEHFGQSLHILAPIEDRKIASTKRNFHLSHATTKAGELVTTIT